MKVGKKWEENQVFEIVKKQIQQTTLDTNEADVCKCINVAAICSCPMPAPNGKSVGQDWKELNVSGR